MAIYFDFEILQSSGKLNEFYISSELRLSLDKILEFITTRLKVLEEESNKYPKGKTLIYILDHDGNAVKHFGYPESLTKRLNGCINDQDLNYLLNQVWDILHPGNIPPTN